MRIDSSVLINKPYAVSCATADNCTYCLCTHAKVFAQINKKFQSDVNKKLIVQRSEVIVSRKKMN